ncbi:hypothetical protein [Novosphingobium panipatense]|uniref:hypothetical protein n=1 Tax=Novosphingobium panipatense TaxID=428991 RepID=UPI003606EF9B
MPSGYRRQHLRIDHFVDLKPYKRPNRMVPGRDLGRETERHAESLKRDLAQAWAGAEGILSLRDAQVVGEPGRYIEFETLPEQPLPDLNWTSKESGWQASPGRTRGQRSVRSSFPTPSRNSSI